MNKYQLSNYLICLVVGSLSLGLLSEFASNANDTVMVAINCILVIVGVAFGFRLIEKIRLEDELKTRVITIKDFFQLMGHLFYRSPD